MNERRRVPATLDLVERAELGLNGLMGTLDPSVDFEPYFLSFVNVRPAYLVHWSSMVSGVLPKYLEAAALLCCMSGSTAHADLERGMIDAILANIADDGLIYDRVDPRRPGTWEPATAGAAGTRTTRTSPATAAWSAAWTGSTS